MSVTLGKNPLKSKGRKWCTASSVMINKEITSGQLQGSYNRVRKNRIQ